jgi:hypothetical protein
VVAAVGDKLRLADWLAEHDLPSVPTRAAFPEDQPRGGLHASAHLTRSA